MNKYSTKIDWSAAKKRYLSNATVSYRDIAREFGVSKTRVAQVASVEDWTKLRQDLVDESQSIFEETLVQNKSDVQDKQLFICRTFQAIVNKKIDKHKPNNYDSINGRELKQLWDVWLDSVKMERSLLGLPNLDKKNDDIPPIPEEIPEEIIEQMTQELLNREP